MAVDMYRENNTDPRLEQGLRGLGDNAQVKHSDRPQVCMILSGGNLCTALVDRAQQRPANVRRLHHLHHHVPAHRFEAFTVGLHHGDGQMACLTDIQVAHDTALAFVRAGHQQAVVAILQLRVLRNGHGRWMSCNEARHGSPTCAEEGVVN